ncbi:hypothetical protein GLOIN_2v1785553 [Rhizophagus irregularis DAOM 181602=DAOM 197198]|nr:hypothetical protein GLOIN_2v1785553 [Rhizophagus irregularis DAOM 181602=DAOM 197198]
MKFQLFLVDLPTLKSLKRTRPNLYVEILTCCFYEDQLEDFMHLFMCKKRYPKLQQILTSYLNHLTQKLKEAGNNANCDYSSQIDRIIFFPCWTFSSSIPHLTFMTVIAAIHNNFINKFRKRIWNSHSYDKGIWEHVMNITSKLKQSSRPKGLPKSSYLPYSSLPPLTHVDSRDSRTDWLMNSMKYGLSWFNHMMEC